MNFRLHLKFATCSTALTSEAKVFERNSRQSLLGAKLARLLLCKRQTYMPNEEDDNETIDQVDDAVGALQCSGVCSTCGAAFN